MGKYLVSSQELMEMKEYMISLNDPAKYQKSIDDITTELAILKVCNNGKTLKDAMDEVA